MLIPDPRGIYGWQRLTERVTTSGRLVDGDLLELSELGIRHVIDLAPSSHHDALDNEGQKLAQLNIQYSLIEVPFNNPTQDHYQAFVHALEAGAMPVHVHCIYNYRVSAFFYRYHLETGMAERDARTLMQPHWSPDSSDHPTARPWKLFIEQSRQQLAA